MSTAAGSPNSRSDPEGGWRNYLTTDITNLQMLDERFGGPREGFNPADPACATSSAD